MTPASGDSREQTAAWRLWLRRKSHRMLPLSVLALALGVFTFSAIERMLALQAERRWYVPDWLNFLGAFGLGLVTTAYLTAAIEITGRSPFRRGNIVRPLALHVGAVVLILAATRALYRGVEALGMPIARNADSSPLKFVIASFIAYGVLVVIMHGVRFVRESRNKERRALELQAELSEASQRRIEAELRALKAELNPRLVVEAVDAIADLVPRDPGRAEQAVSHLEGVMRGALHRGSIREVSLSEELETLQPFIALERARLGGRLEVRVEADQEVSDALVPDMVLQPLVSTVLDGRAASGDTPRLMISAAHDRQAPESLVVRVTGAGMQSAPVDNESSWHAAVRTRLLHMYGERSSLTISARDQEVTGTLVLPYHDVEQPEQPAVVVAGTDRPARVRHHILRGVLLIAAFAAAYVQVSAMNAEGDTLKRVTGVALPPYFLELTNAFGALVMLLVMLAAVEMNRRAPWTDASMSTLRKVWLHGRMAFVVAVLHTGEKVATSVPYGIIANRGSEYLVMKTVTTVVGTMWMYAIFATVTFVLLGLVNRVLGYRKELRLKAELSTSMQRRAEAELRALQAELNPHFLGNALHTVAALIHSSPDQALHVLRQISQLLREPLSRPGSTEVTLAEELAMLHPFLEVERARFRRPLPVRWEVTSDALRAQVPRMILQPLVENAVRHGVASDGSNPSSGIEVRARRSGAALEISVSDDGHGIDPGVARARRGPHIGVANTRARLHELYGGAGTFELAARVEGGTVARISLPWHEGPVPVPAGTTSPIAAAMVPA